MLKKYLIVILTFLFVASLLTAVGAQERKQLVVIGHKVHQAIAVGGEGKGRDLIKDFEEKYNVDVIYQTYPTPKVHEKFLHLGPLKDPGADIIYLLDRYCTKDRMMKFLEPLDSYLKIKPIDGFPEEWSPAMVEANMSEGSHFMIPIRVGNFALWYNKQIFQERGISSPPKTPEELYDIAKKCTYVRPDGEKVFGWTCRGLVSQIVDTLTNIVRMWDGDFIAPDLRVTTNETPAIEAVKLLQSMYQEGIMPPDWPTFAYAENTRLFQEGRAAMGLFASSYHALFNDPEKSKIAGNAVAALLPLAREYWTSERDFCIGSGFGWSQGILRGSKNKDLAWEYIRFLASRDSHFNMARSGNSPARNDVLQDPEYSKINPAAKLDAKMAPYTRATMPAFLNQKQVCDIIGRHVQNVVVYNKSPQEEMDKAAEEAKPLLP